ncbi:MAG: type IV pilus assembly protein PilB [Elusimicrobia bacterium]|nr:MAG: type IV pilus assembly protein PilB [Elusimicrobiota bacterium]
MDVSLFSRPKNLRSVLIDEKTLSAVQADQANVFAQQEGLPFHEAIVRLGFIDEASVAATLSKTLQLPHADRASRMLEVDMDSGLNARIPEEFARANHVLPLFEEGGTLTVAMADPTDMSVVNNLQTVSGLQIQSVVATRSDIMAAIDQLYQNGGGDLLAHTVQASTVDGLDSSSVRTDVRLDLDQVIKGGEGAYAVNLVNAAIKQALIERASDIHIETCDREVVLRFRIDGVLHPRTPPAFQAFDSIVSRVKILARLNIAERRLPQDGSFSLKMQNRIIDVRVSICPAAYGEKLVLRLLDKQAAALNIELLGFEPVQRDDFLAAAQQPNGLILLTGPTGSGKTTTLYSILNRIKTVGKNFMSIEDPIEIKFRGMTQVAVRSEIGLTFASALRSFLRQDPDVILVGEVRDQETAQTCLRAAMTGHLVLATLHTNDALAAVVRLIDLESEPHLIASSLTLLAAQRLVRVLCPKCREPYAPPRDLVVMACKEAGVPEPAADADIAPFFKPKGCEHCAMTGYKGRLGVSEVFPITEKMRDIIARNGRDAGLLREAARESKRIDLRASCWMKVFRGITSVEELMAVTVRQRFA